MKKRILNKNRVHTSYNFLPYEKYLLKIINVSKLFIENVHVHTVHTVHTSAIGKETKESF